MRCTSSPESASCPAVGEVRLLSSLLALGALFGLMTSPCARAPLTSAFVVVGVPLLTFLVAAPARLGALAELRLFARDAQAGLLSALLVALGRRAHAARVVSAHRADVEAAYAAHPRVRPLVDADPLRLHHARRLAVLGAALAVGAGVFLPFIAGDTYTYGDGGDAVLVFLLDVAVFGVFGRIVAERVGVRLFEASASLTGGGAWSSRLRAVPLVTLLGGALGAVGSLVVLFAGATASGVESVLATDADFAASTLWFLRATAPMALSLGVSIGAVMGLGCALAQPERE